MVSGSQGKLTDHRSNMWPVVVLGIITAVLAWVWFGSRGKEKSEDTDQEREDTRLVTHLTSLPEEPECEDTQPQETPDTRSVLSAGQASLSHHTATQLDKEKSTTGTDEGDGQGETLHEDLVQDHKEDGCHLTAPHKEGVHIRQDPPQQSKPEVHQSTGVEEQVHEDLSPSGDTGDDVLVGAREELHLSIGGQETRVTAEDLKSAMITEEKLVQTSKENDVIVPDKVVPISAKTGLMHPDRDQDDGGTLVNGSDEPVQKDNGTVCQENVTNCNASAITISSRQVNSENNFGLYDHSKLESSEQSEMVLAFDKKPLLTLENTTCAQVNGQMTNHVSTESCQAEVVIHQKAEDVTLISPTVDKCVFLHSSNQEEQSPDFKWSGSSENSCFATPSEAKLNDDPQRTKRVAAVQPIPQNVSLGFKVHYITHTDSQVIAVIGDHEKLGEWERHVPLSSDKDGNWSHSLALPADANVEWKFVMVENGKIKRWEECNNRHLRTAHEDLATQQWWGYP
ncbi:starch-binding domain-containing protein 1 [Lithobates pipiens]